MGALEHGAVPSCTILSGDKEPPLLSGGQEVVGHGSGLLSPSKGTTRAIPRLPQGPTILHRACALMARQNSQAANRDAERLEYACVFHGVWYKVLKTDQL